MKNSFIIYFFIFFLSSCISTNQVFFSDPNYLSSDDFSSVERINDAYPEEDINLVDTATNNEEYYQSDDYYDFSYSSRIRRFHRPMMLNYGFYSGFYTDYYWYNPDPFYWGSSIYSGYGWDYPYYSFSPFYSYYSPFHYNYYSWNNYGHHGHYGHHDFHNHNNFYSNNINNNYTYGPRGNLNSNNRNLIKTNVKTRDHWKFPNSNVTNSKTYKTTKTTNNRSSSINNILNNTLKNNSNKKEKGSRERSNYTKQKTYKSKNTYKSNNRSNFRSSGSRPSGTRTKSRSPKRK